MGVITIANLNGGINVKSDPTAIADDGLQDCVGFDLTTEGIVKTSGGLALNDISDKLPVGAKQWQEILYIGSTRYILTTTETGLFANGLLVRAGFTGRFKGVSFLNNIYLVNGSQAVRFDGTNCFQWGITAPTAVPTISKGTWDFKVIDSFDSLATWITNKVNCTIAAEASIKVEGTQSMKVTVASGVRGYSYVANAKDLTLFSSSRSSSTTDYIKFWFYVDNLANLEECILIFDVGDGTFTKDTFSFSIVSPGTDSAIQSLGIGKTADVVTEDTVTTNSGPSYDGSSYYDYTLQRFVYENEAIPNVTTTTITKNTTKTIVDPILTDQILSFWRRNTLLQLKSATWIEVKIPKSAFIQNGTNGWDTVAAVKLEIAATSHGNVNIYIDDLRMVGGSDLVGDYWFTYSYARLDANNNVVHESAPSRNLTTKQMNIIGPVTFDREPLAYSLRPLSGDPQVNGAIIGILGGGLSSFWVLAQINDNTTASGTLYDIGEKSVGRLLLSQHNEPAPAGTDVTVFQNKIWMVGDSNYPRVLRSSDILNDGTLAPEGWPTRNGYDLEGNKGTLTNISLVNKVPMIKGTSGEWALQVLDPVDYLQVKAKQVSNLGLIGQDAVIAFETSTIYTSPGGFVESNGGSANFILPEAQPLIDSNMSSAIGVNAGLVSYFTYESNLSGQRTAKIDLFRGKPRFANVNSVLLECLSKDEVTNKIYAIRSGEVFLLDSGFVDESTPERTINALLKSKAYGLGGLVSWNRMEIIHDTGGCWCLLYVYIDGVLRATMPFTSTTRTTTNFRDFGPRSGYTFQFVISGTFTNPGTIFFPIRIYHGGK